MMNKADKVPYLNCCKQSILVTLKNVYESSHDVEALLQCKSCNSYWFYRFHEYVTFLNDDDLTTWHSPLTPEEARHILESQDRPDFSFLSDRLSFMKDKEGIKQVKGQPTYPWI